jgi:hypothetical protein
MSESTIAKLVMAQRDRELRAEQRWGVADLVGLPLAAVLFLLFLSWVVVAGIVACIGRLCLPAEETVAQDTPNRDRPRG